MSNPRYQSAILGAVPLAEDRPAKPADAPETDHGPGRSALRDPQRQVHDLKCWPGRDGCQRANDDDLVTSEDCDCWEMGRDCDHPDNEIQWWCTTPDCVRPVTSHPDGMHLTIDGCEFSDPPPMLRVVTP